MPTTLWVSRRSCGSAGFGRLPWAQGMKLTPHVVVGHPVPIISDFVASEGFDLLVVGYMGHSALYNRLIGSTTDRLVEHAPSAVLVVK